MRPKPGCRVILSVNYPLIYKVIEPAADYFTLTEYSEEYVFNGQPETLTFWHRPLHAMTDAFAKAGFRIAVVSEPPIASDAPRELLPLYLHDRTAFVGFIFFALEQA